LVHFPRRIPVSGRFFEENLMVFPFTLLFDEEGTFVTAKKSNRVSP
jgi:hypothetical protein